MRVQLVGWRVAVVGGLSAMRTPPSSHAFCALLLGTRQAGGRMGTYALDGSIGGAKGVVGFRVQ